MREYLNAAAHLEFGLIPRTNRTQESRSFPDPGAKFMRACGASTDSGCHIFYELRLLPERPCHQAWRRIFVRGLVFYRGLGRRGLVVGVVVIG